MQTLKKKIGTALAATTILFGAPACAQVQSTPAPIVQTQVPVAEQEMSGPALWVAKDEDTTIYLFGTVHALPDGIEWYTGPIADALAASGSIVTEIKMDDSMAAEAQRLVMAKGVLPAGTTLRGLMSEDEKATYETAMQKLGIPVAAFDQQEPWSAGMAIAMLPLLQQGYSAENGVEKVLLANSGDKPQKALETMAFQINTFDGLPQESQMKFLIDAAANVDSIKDQLDALVAEWVEGDPEGLAEIMNDGLEDQALADALLYSRNENWAVWIDDRMDAPGTVFMAVGAAHLGGEKSVQDYLEVRGIKTYRVQ